MRQRDEISYDNFRLPFISGALTALLLSSTLFTPLFKVSQVSLNLNSFTTQEEVLEFAEIETGKSILPFLSEGQILKKLKKHPYILNADLHKQWPQKLKIDITYRQDRFAMPNAGFYIILDDELHVLRVDKMFYDATVIEGFTFKEFKIGEKITVDQGKVLQRVVSLKHLMEKSHVTYLSKLTYADGGITAYTKQGLRVTYGDLTNLEARFNSSVEIFDNLHSKGIKTGLIDVSSDGLPIYKPFGK